MATAFSELMQLSVGGSPFLTTGIPVVCTTLCAQPDTLASMFSGDTEPTLLRDAEGRYFIDRDGKHFSRVLNYLRDGALVLPASDQECQELRTEAEFYNLTSLAGLVDARMEAAERRRQERERQEREQQEKERAAARQAATVAASPRRTVYGLQPWKGRVTALYTAVENDLYELTRARTLPFEERAQIKLQMYSIESKILELELNAMHLFE